jgi:hypothetical protein
MRDLSETGSFIPQDAADLIRAAQDSGGNASKLAETAKKLLFPSMHRSCKGGWEQQSQIKLLAIGIASARLARYIVGSGGPVERDFHAAYLCAVSTELSKKNMCREGYPQNSTIDNAFAQLALLVYTLFGNVVRNRSRRCS